MPSKLEALLARDAAERRALALAAARRVATDQTRLGIDVRLVGSLARSTFAGHSDIDLLVVGCPTAWRYRLESVVEDVVGGLPFDVIYLDEVPEHRREALLAEARRASDLR